ncbi:DUF6233 domain-containing protein [Streptomyces sp. NPDC058611]|uniref:DUF6233 domain-containing protein n=1 Tax=unclassified Streptomyces TaxID=2593676 RepID=UPI003660D645
MLVGGTAQVNARRVLAARWAGRRGAAPGASRAAQCRACEQPFGAAVSYPRTRFGRRGGPPAPASAAGLETRSIRTGSGPKALRVHVGDCAMSGGKPLGCEEARRMLAEGIEPCPYCSPENPLGMTS